MHDEEDLTPSPGPTKQSLRTVVTTATLAIILALGIAAGALFLASRSVESAERRADELAESLELERENSSCRNAIGSRVTNANTDLFIALSMLVISLGTEGVSTDTLVDEVVVLSEAVERLDRVRDIRTQYEDNPRVDCPIAVADQG